MPIMVRWVVLRQQLLHILLIMGMSRIWPFYKYCCVVNKMYYCCSRKTVVSVIGINTMIMIILIVILLCKPLLPHGNDDDVYHVVMMKSYDQYNLYFDTTFYTAFTSTSHAFPYYDIDSLIHRFLLFTMKYFPLVTMKGLLLLSHYSPIIIRYITLLVLIQEQLFVELILLLVTGEAPSASTITAQVYLSSSSPSELSHNYVTISAVADAVMSTTTSCTSPSLTSDASRDN